MEQIIINGKIKNPYDTESNWTSSKRILLEGEIAITSETGYYKVGNGVSKWSELEYSKSPLTKQDIINILGYTPLDTSISLSDNTDFEPLEEV